MCVYPEFFWSQLEFDWSLYFFIWFVFKLQVSFFWIKGFDLEKMTGAPRERWPSLSAPRWSFSLQLDRGLLDVANPALTAPAAGLSGPIPVCGAPAASDK